MNKRILHCVVAVVLLFAMTVPSVFAAENAFKTTAAATVSAGDTFTVSFTHPTAQTVSSLGLTVAFSNSDFEIVSIDNAPYTDLPPDVNGSNTAGTVSISYTDPSYDANTALPANTVLLSVHFRVKDDAVSGTKSFTVTDYNVLGAVDPTTWLPADITPGDAVIGTKTLTVEVVSEITGTIALNGVAAPEKKATPTVAAAVTAPANVTVTSLDWTPAHAVFAGDTVYTATLNVKANTGYVFGDGVSFTVDGVAWTAAKQADGSYNLSHAFPITAGKDNPVYTVPAGITVQYGQKLSAAAFPHRRQRYRRGAGYSAAYGVHPLSLPSVPADGPVPTDRHYAVCGLSAVYARPCL